MAASKRSILSALRRHEEIQERREEASMKCIADLARIYPSALPSLLRQMVKEDKTLEYGSSSENIKLTEKGRAEANGEYQDDSDDNSSSDSDSERRRQEWIRRRRKRRERESRKHSKKHRRKESSSRRRRRHREDESSGISHDGDAVGESQERNVGNTPDNVQSGDDEVVIEAILTCDEIVQQKFNQAKENDEILTID